MNGFSVFVPIHNDSDFLRYTLKSIVDLEPNEIVFYFDMCDHEEFVRFLLDRINFNGDVKFVHNENLSNFKFHVAYVKFSALFFCSYDSILFCDVDIILDVKKIRENLDLSFYKIISFDKVDYPLKLSFEIRKPFTFFMNKPSGVFLVSKKVFLDNYDFIVMSNLEMGVDFYFHKVVSSKFPSKFVHSKCVHLRPRNMFDRDFLYGKNAYFVLNRSFFRAILSGLLSFKFNYVRGYLNARSKNT